MYSRAKAATVAVFIRQSDGTLHPFGSGVNVSPTGIIVTCKHVVEAAQLARDESGDPPELPRAKVGLQTGTLSLHDLVIAFTDVRDGRVELIQCRCEVIHGPHDSDLAVARLRPDERLPFVQIGDSDTVVEGDPVFTCGFPLGSELQPGFPVGSLFSSGVVSGVRPHPVVRPRASFLLDMTINEGNSGGPLISELSGRLVGIVDAAMELEAVPTGIGCAVPVNLVKGHVGTLKNVTSAQIEGIAEGIWPGSEVR